uniref:Putative secreted protein n=1 Tax=Ixodes ricinus TaxID=34613 RepID=A0A6B0UIF2_IXORI
MAPRTADGHSELVLVLLAAVVKLLLHTSVPGCVEDDALVTARHRNRLVRPRESVRWTRMRQQLALSVARAIIKVEVANHTAIRMTGKKSFPRNTAGQRNNI